MSTEKEACHLLVSVFVETNFWTARPVTKLLQNREKKSWKIAAREGPGDPPMLKSIMFLREPNGESVTECAYLEMCAPSNERGSLEMVQHCNIGVNGV